MEQADVAGCVAVVAPLNVEFKAVRKHLQELHRIWHEAGTAAEIGWVTGVPWPVALVVTGPGRDQSAVLAERIVTWLRPRALFIAGVAGGLSDDIELGDVVVATWVYGYHSGKEDDAGFHARPRAWRSDHRLEQASRMADISGTWAASLSAQPSVHFRPIAAGDVVLNSRDSPLCDQLHRNYEDAAAIEMESAGAASAAQLNGPLPVLTIRGISDRADGDKELTDARLQPVAAAHAAAFTVAVLRELATATGAHGREPGTTQPGHGWRPLAQPLTGTGLPDIGVPRPSSATTLELCLLPAQPLPPQAQLMIALPAQLTALGRAAGVFRPGVDVTELVRVAAAALTAEAGLAVTSRGHRCGWQTLPKDNFGSVLDLADITARLTCLLTALTGIDLARPEEAGLAVTVTTSVLLAEGRARDVPRTSPSGPTSMSPVRVPADGVLPWAQIAARPAEVAAELAAQLLLAFRTRKGGGLR